MKASVSLSLLTFKLPFPQPAGSKTSVLVMPLLLDYLGGSIHLLRVKAFGNLLQGH